jgi:hypothetical protein
MTDHATNVSKDPLDREALQEELLAVFERYGLDVGVGLITNGVCLRSQDPRVDAINLGVISVLEEG